MRLEYFLMIDRVEELDLDNGFLRTSSTVPQESTVFEGHFPDYPLVPGVLLIETMAQASGILMLYHKDYRRMPLLAGVKDAKIRDFIRPNARLAVEVRLEHDGSGFAIVKTIMRCDGKRVANALLTMTEIEWPFPQFKQDIRDKVEGLFDGIPIA